MKTLIIFSLIAALALSIDCTNKFVFNSGNTYSLGDAVVGEDNFLYISKKNSNYGKPLFNTIFWNKQEFCDGACASPKITTFKENQNYPTGTTIRFQGVLYQNTRDSDNEYPDPLLYNSPWVIVGTCYVSCVTAQSYQPAPKQYNYNSIVKDTGYLYISTELQSQTKPSTDFGQGHPWRKLLQCIPQGVLQNYDISGIKGTLTPCYSEVYGGQTKEEELQNCTGKSMYVLVGGYALTNPNVLLVAAYGNSNNVLQLTTSTSVANPDNGAYWYNVLNYSFGFADQANIYLTCADATGVFDSNPFTNTRVSWHLCPDGGWRLGNLIWLNSSPDYQKVIYLVN